MDEQVSPSQWSWEASGRVEPYICVYVNECVYICFPASVHSYRMCEGKIMFGTGRVNTMVPNLWQEVLNLHAYLCVFIKQQHMFMMRIVPLSLCSPCINLNICKLTMPMCNRRFVEQESHVNMSKADILIIFLKSATSLDFSISVNGISIHPVACLL